MTPSLTKGFWASRAARCARFNRPAPPNTHKAACMVNFSPSSILPPRDSTNLLRRCTRMPGMSIFTGQTSAQGAAERTGERQRAGGFEPAQLRRQDRADRPLIHAVIGMSAGAGVNRAHVQAARAANAGQGLPRDPDRPGSSSGHYPAAPGEMPAAVAVMHAGPERGIGIGALAGGRTRQQLQEHFQILQARKTFSMPMRDINTRGRVRHMRPLPSDSTTQTLPVSAMAKLAPEMATGVCMNFCRK